MGSQRLDQLAEAADLDGSELLYVLQGGTDRHIKSDTYQQAVYRDIRLEGAVADGATSAVQATKDALASYDRVIITGGTYFFDGQVDVSGNKELHIAADATVLVQNGYTGTVFRLVAPNTDQTNGESFLSPRITGHGTIIEENVSPGRQETWVGIEVFADGSSSTAHVVDPYVGRVKVLHPNVGLKLHADGINGNAFISGGVFECFTDFCVVGAEFVEANGGQILSNTFNTFGVQTRSNSTHGFKDVTGAENTFIDCEVWDTSATGALVANILSTADKTMFVGRTHYSGNIDDQGSDTLFVHPSNGMMRHPMNSPGGGTEQIVLLAKINDGEGRRVNGRVRAYRSHLGWIPSIAEFHVSAGQTSADGRQAATCVKHGAISDQIPTVRLVECDYNAARWLGLELSGTDNNHYPDAMDFVGQLVNAAVPESVDLANCSNIAAHTPDTDLDTPTSRITGTGEEPFAVTTDANAGTATFSGDGTTTAFAVPHGLSGTPTARGVWGESADAAGDKYVSSVDATNINVTFATAPASGTNNVVLGFDARV